MHDDWDEYIHKVEKEFGERAAQIFSDLIDVDPGLAYKFVGQLYCGMDVEKTNTELIATDQTNYLEFADALDKQFEQIKCYVLDAMHDGIMRREWAPLDAIVTALRMSGAIK